MKPFRISIKTFRRRLASIDSVPQFAILGICSGLVTGLVIILFRKMVEIPLEYLLPDNKDNFEGLDLPYYFLLPFLGGMVLAILLSVIKPEFRQVGVTHVLQRLGRNQGHLPAGNLFTQLIAGTIGLATGQSGGREGPAIHLGAAGSSLLGQYLKLPDNSIRILVGCGAAAAIAGCFNTPIAGVIFSMEVIIMEYTIAGFIPVILAAVVAVLINQLVFGSDTLFHVPALAMSSYNELPFLVLEGIVIGVIAAIYVKSIQIIYRFAPQQLWLRLMVAATFTGLAALAVPQILGVGYDTVNSALLGNLSLTILLAACLFKILTSATSVALGMPVGLIGPTLFIGATAGGFLVSLANGISGSDDHFSTAFYVMLGMGAMMGAVLQAPLAALMAIMEMTQNPGIILPAMLVIIVANITSREFFKVESVYHTQMEMKGMEFRLSPFSMALNRTSVASIMTRNFQSVSSHIDRETALSISEAEPLWLLVEGENGPHEILESKNLTLFLLEHRDATTISLDDVPADRRKVTPIRLQATLDEALDTLNKNETKALYIYVNRISSPLLKSPVGILTREDIESCYTDHTYG